MKMYDALAAFQAVDAAACAAQVPPIRKALDDVHHAENLRPILPVVKAASAIGLASVRWFPAPARLTTFMLTVYFVLAVGSHLRAKDFSPGLVASSSLLGVFGAMTVQGPATQRR